MSQKQLFAMLASFGRVAASTTLAAVVAVWKTTPNQDLLTWTQNDWKAFMWGIIAAVGLTVVNALRKGDPRFGRGATDGSLPKGTGDGVAFPSYPAT